MRGDSADRPQKGGGSAALMKSAFGLRENIAHGNTKLERITTECLHGKVNCVRDIGLRP